MEESERRASKRGMRAAALFIGFPSPMLVKDNEYAKALRRCGIQLRQPRGIVVASAHWHTVRPLRVTGSQKPRQLHDYGDCPSWLAAGTPAVIDAGQGLDFAATPPGWPAQERRGTDSSSSSTTG